jgi:undecaprenyl-diphosphatase
MGSLIGYGMLAYLLIAFWPPARRHRTAIVIGTAVLVLLIGMSRLYLGVHFLSDVIGGYAAGAPWLVTCVTGVDLALRQRGLAPWDVGVERRKETRVAPVSRS